MVRERVGDGREAAHVVTARELVDQASAILLDFDGPVCSVFAGLPAAQVAEDMRVRLRSFDPALDMQETGGDPLDALRAAREHSPEAGRLAEALLACAELEAVKFAQPTDGAAEFLEAMHKRGTPVAIVSNNGERAIRAYLERFALAGLVVAVSARDPTDARLMKPHPRSLEIAVSQLRSDRATTVMVGDSQSDVVAAQSSGTRVVAYANKDHKAWIFASLGADSVITSMRQLID